MNTKLVVDETNSLPTTGGRKRRRNFTSKRTTSEELPQPDGIYTNMRVQRDPISDGTVSPQKEDRSSQPQSSQPYDLSNNLDCVSRPRMSNYKETDPLEEEKELFYSQHSSHESRDEYAEISEESGDQSPKKTLYTGSQSSDDESDKEVAVLEKDEFETENEELIEFVQNDNHTFE